MIARATGLFSIYRETTTNDSGDEVDDNDNPIAVDVPLALHNFSVDETNPNTAFPRTVTGIRGRANAFEDLRVQDRIRNQTTDQWYLIDTVTAPLSSTGLSDLRFEAHRVN